MMAEGQTVPGTTVNRDNPRSISQGASIALRLETAMTARRLGKGWMERQQCGSTTKARLWSLARTETSKHVQAPD
jgi:hypothetical protein